MSIFHCLRQKTTSTVSCLLFLELWSLVLTQQKSVGFFITWKHSKRKISFDATSLSTAWQGAWIHATAFLEETPGCLQWKHIVFQLFCLLPVWSMALRLSSITRQVKKPTSLLLKHVLINSSVQVCLFRKYHCSVSEKPLPRVIGHLVINSHDSVVFCIRQQNMLITNVMQAVLHGCSALVETSRKQVTRHATIEKWMPSLQHSKNLDLGAVKIRQKSF